MMSAPRAGGDGPTMIGFCRVTVVAPTMRVDVALPEDVAVADLLPEIVRLTDQSQAEYAYSGFVLTRLGSGPLDTGLSLVDQGVRSGDLLYLRPLAERQPPVVYDEVVDALASSVEDSQPLWGPRTMRTVCLTFGGVGLLLAALVLLLAGRPHGTPAIAAAVVAVAVLAFGGTRSRVYGDHGGAAVLAAGALPHAFVAGLGVLQPTAPTQTAGPQLPAPVVPLPTTPLSAVAGLGRTELLAALAAVLVYAVTAAVVLGGRRSVFIGAAIASAIGSVALFVAVFAASTPVQTAAVTATVTLAMIGFLPGFAVRAARLPAPTVRAADSLTTEEDDDPVEADVIRSRAQRGHEILAGLVGACTAALLGCCLVLAFSASDWARWFAAVLGLAMLVRARIFRKSRQVTLLAVGGLVALALVLLSVAVHLSGTERVGWGFGLLLGYGLLIGGVGILVPGRSFSPLWGRLLDTCESLVLISVIPVCLQVLHLYSVARDFAA